jgi:hypothetical protein
MLTSPPLNVSYRLPPTMAELFLTSILDGHLSLCLSLSLSLSFSLSPTLPSIHLSNHLPPSLPSLNEALGIESRASHMLGRHYTLNDITSSFIFLFGDRVSLSWRGWPQTCSPLALASEVAGITHHRTWPHCKFTSQPFG